MSSRPTEPTNPDQAADLLATLEALRGRTNRARQGAWVVPIVMGALLAADGAIATEWPNSLTMAIACTLMGFAGGAVILGAKRRLAERHGGRLEPRLVLLRAGVGSAVGIASGIAGPLVLALALCATSLFVAGRVPGRVPAALAMALNTLVMLWLVSDGVGQWQALIVFGAGLMAIGVAGTLVDRRRVALT